MGIGAISTLAVDAAVTGLDLDAVGWIPMLAGVAGPVLFSYFSSRRRVPRTEVIERRSYADIGQPPA